MKKGLLLNLSPLIKDYKMVSAHEILLAYGGHKYSKSHKGSSTVLTQSDLGLILPATGEIDLMKYYDKYYDISRTVVAKEDLMCLLWLTKLKIK